MCRRSGRDLHRDRIRAYKCRNGYLQIKCRVRGEGSKESESYCFLVSREVLNIKPLALYEPQVIPDFIQDHIYKRLVIGLKIQSKISHKD